MQYPDDTEQQYRRLLCAILLRAFDDLHSRNAMHRAEALAWLHSDGAQNACEWLDIHPAKLRSLAWRKPDKMG
jgi:hypothetical protein